ncbi:MAG: hypothetical protein ACRENA_01755 [Vulcanimicrobiaceae bacterium]
MRTWLFLFLVCATAGVVAGCRNGTSGTSSPTPIPTQSSRAGVDILAFGDDFTVGIGTSSCGAPPSVASGCTTSATAAGVATNINPQGWAQVLAGYIATIPRWQPSGYVGLGVTGALSGDSPGPENGFSGDVLHNSGQFGSLTTLVKTVRSDNIKTLILIQSGINDTLDAFYTQQCIAGGGTVVGGGGATIATPCIATGTTLAPGGDPRTGTLYAAYSTMLADLNALAGGPPEGTIVVGVPNLGQIPWCVANLTPSQCAALTTDAQQANSAIQDAIADAADKQVAFADWYTYFNNNPAYYTTAYFASDLFHLNNQGNAVLEQLVQQTLLNAVQAGTFNMSSAVGSPQGAH